MQPGFVLDRGHANSRQTPLWIAGTPERSFWLGIKTAGKEQAEVRTFRCTSCRYLESYAP